MKSKTGNAFRLQKCKNHKQPQSIPNIIRLYNQKKIRISENSKPHLHSLKSEENTFTHNNNITISSDSEENRLNSDLLSTFSKKHINKSSHFLSQQHSRNLIDFITKKKNCATTTNIENQKLNFKKKEKRYIDSGVNTISYYKKRKKKIKFPDVNNVGLPTINNCNSIENKKIKRIINPKEIYKVYLKESYERAKIVFKANHDQNFAKFKEYRRRTYDPLNV